MFKIFDRFFTDESSSWEPSRKTSLSMNLQTEFLNGVRLGDPPEKLRVFGRPDNKQPFKNARFEYRLLGFDTEHENGKIINFAFKVNEQSSLDPHSFGQHTFQQNPPQFANCELTLIAASGKQLNIHRWTTLKEVEQILGVAPDKKYDQDEGYCENSTYRQNRLMLAFFWHEDKRIEEVIVEEWKD